MGVRKISENIFQFPLFKRFLKDSLTPSKNTIRILAYHKVIDFNEDNYEFDLGIISANREKFIREIEYLKKNYNLINFKDLAEMEDAGGSLPPNLLIITFDDGYFDNYDIVYPILKEFGINATIYLVVNHIDTKEIFWWEKLVYLLKKSKVDHLEIDGLNIKTKHFQKNKEQLIQKILWNIREAKNNIRLKILDEIEDKLEVKLDDGKIDNRYIFPLTWEQVKEMQQYGIEFGSHTLTHPILSSLNDDDLKKEIVDSKNILEEKIGEKVISIAYPAGFEYAYNESVIRYAKLAGYKYGTIYESGINYFPLKNHLELNRIRCEHNIRFNSFKCFIEFPQIFLR
jgi:peptidoglycan/xylan/chitin deacetylase (PgdA/CDA1 family)